jgi:hypothetical protein
MTDPAPAVTGKPLRWLQLDGLVLLAAALILFASTHQPWWLVPAVILLPDLFMLGYLRGTRAGAAVYNLGHSYSLPAAMSLAGALGHHPLTLALGLLWLAHIGMDRLARYGLKYDIGFQHTHLGGPGPADPRRTAEPGCRTPARRHPDVLKPGFTAPGRPLDPGVSWRSIWPGAPGS